MRKKIIAANWKMHKTIVQTSSFFHQMKGKIPENLGFEVWVAPPFTALYVASRAVRECNLKMALGGQNMHEAEQGAFTGEISGLMLKEAGSTFCILGHSERRAFFHESDKRICAKVKKALEIGLIPLLCIGEPESDREKGCYMDVLQQQLLLGLSGIDIAELKNVVIAYEPVWAIGTGKSATSEIAQETHGKIRSFIGKKWGKELADFLPILYGGSVNVGNAADLLRGPDIDGALIGGASLESSNFIQILNHALGIVKQ